jgi:two-component system NtrC family sensor kinase
MFRLVRTVARHTRLADVWPELHQQAIHFTGAVTSVLLRWNPRTGDLVPSSAVGLEQLDPDPWFTTGAARAAAERVWSEGAPLVFTDVTELKTRLGADAAILVPVTAREARLALLALGVNELKQADAGQAHAGIIGELIALTLERARLQREANLQQDLRELVTEFSRAVSSSLHLGASLEIFCDRARRLFAADLVSVWLHDRRARMIDLVASSDPAEPAGRHRIRADDKDNPIALVMRTAHASMMSDDDQGSAPPSVLVPLRGRRRAIGTLAIEGVRVEIGDEFDLLERLEEVGRQLSVAIENLWLLEDVLRSRRELESAVNSVNDLVIVTDAKSRITHANQAFGRRAGRRPEEIFDRPLDQFFGDDVLQWLGQLGATGGSSSQFHTQELDDPVLGGTFVFTASPLVSADAERMGMVVVARDVSEKSQDAAERVELRRRLTQSEKLAALGQFVAGIAHELNNPLQAVLGHLELMLHGSAQTSARARRDLKIVFREADRAAKIVHNLLVFAGSRRITRRRLNVSLVVQRALSLRAGACAAAGIEVVKHLAPKLPRVAGDSLLLQQTLLNVIVNAEQALQSIDLSAIASAKADEPRRIEARTFARADRVVIEIADNGPGIPDEALTRLFEPFFTTKEVGKGTGLGLAIAYGIVQEHGGELHASSRPEGGAVFTIELPAADAVE